VALRTARDDNFTNGSLIRPWIRRTSAACLHERKRD